MKCQKCGGREVVERDGRLHECICSFLNRMAASMPPYIRKAEIMPKHLELSIFKAVDISIYIISTWTDMKAIIKAVVLKNPNKLIRITSDAEIRDVFVGSKSKASKSKDFEGEIFNNLQDLMDPPDLMIVRLNELAYKNRAAAGALEEALCYRLDREKPTWVLSNLDKIFASGSFAYSESVAELLSTGYSRVRIPNISKKKDISESIFFTNVETEESLSTFQGADTSSDEKRISDRQRKPKEIPQDDSVVSNSLSRYGQGIVASRNKSWRRD